MLERFRETRGFAQLTSGGANLGMGSGNRRVGIRLNMRPPGQHHARDDLHVSLWANGAELYADENSLYITGVRYLAAV